MTELPKTSIAEPRSLFWLILLSEVSPVPLGYIRDNRSGAFIIGGKTGSHYTGHTETWWDKLSEIAALGYIPIEIAIHQKLISPDWTPPVLGAQDALLVRRIQNGEI